MDRLLFDVDPKDCRSHNNFLEVFIAVFIACGLLISYLPQHYRIISLKSSEGISPWFLLLGAVSMTCSFFNILILQIPQLECCKYVSGRACFENTLGVTQLTIQWFMFTMILILFMAYFPQYRKYIPIGLDDVAISKDWSVSLYVTAFVTLHFIFTLVVSVYLLIFVGKADEHDLTKYWADALGIISLILASVQYLPQIWRTWQRKTVGALSIPMMLVQTPGSFLFVYSLATREGTRWTTWIVFLITGCLQGTLLIMCICWYYREQREKCIEEPIVDVPNERTALLNTPNDPSSIIVDDE